MMAPSTSPVPATSPLPRTLSGRQAGRVLKPGKEAPGSRSAFRVCACSGRSNTCSSLSGLRRGDQQRPPAERRAASASSRRVLPPPEGRGRGGRGRPEPRARPAGPAAAGTRAPLGGELGGRGFTARSAARLRPPRPQSLGRPRWGSGGGVGRNHGLTCGVAVPQVLFPKRILRAVSTRLCNRRALGKLAIIWGSFGVTLSQFSCLPGHNNENLAAINLLLEHLRTILFNYTWKVVFFLHHPTLRLKC